MQEFHFLPGTTEKLTQENLSKFGFKLDIDNDGYAIKSDFGTIYGFSYNNELLSFCPGRSIGNWKEILKQIDKLFILEFYDDDFENEWGHSNWSEEESDKKFLEEVIKNRKIFNLPLDKYIVYN